MEIKSDDLLIIENPPGSKDSKKRIISLNCLKCGNIPHKFEISEECVNCILKAIKKYKRVNIGKIVFANYEREIDLSKIKDLQSFFLKEKKIRKIWKKLESFKRCEFKEFNCKNIKFLKFNIIDIQKTISDPIRFYLELYDLKQRINEEKVGTDPVCIDCISKVNQSLNKIIKILKKFQFLEDLLKIDDIKPKNVKSWIFYANFFGENQIFTRVCQCDQTDQEYQYIADYFIGEAKEFQIKIFEVIYESEKYYESNLNVSDKLNKDYIHNLIKDIDTNLELVDINQIHPFEDLLEIYRTQAFSYLNKNYQFPKEEASKISLYATLERINLIKIFPLLIDDYVEEVFLDSPNRTLYLNHQKFGRCRTKISFNKHEIERLKTFLRVYSSKRLDYSFPSTKLVIKNKFFYCRFAIDISPIALNGFALDIRKLNKNIMTIQDLLKNNTLNPKMASFLYFSVLRRVNITVTGETNTGKTTLINALDLITPKEFRKIYVESINESLNQLDFNRHQLKFRVDSLDNSNHHKFSKENQIKTLLHRTPDIIYLGEILTMKEAKAMFHCLAAGLRGFQTIHANDVESLINRFLFHFKIPKNCLNDLDIIILMKKIKNQRKVVSISEIKGPRVEICPIYTYDPQTTKFELNLNLIESQSVLKLKRFEKILKDNFYFILSIYDDIFSTLKQIKRLSIDELASFFDKISYLSLYTPQRLENYWFVWKKRILN